MPGVDAKTKEIVRRLKSLSDVAREIELGKLADTHGIGFANAVRRQVTPAKKAKQ